MKGFVMLLYEKKVAVITGAASGIGKAMVEKCLQKKMKVMMADINQPALFEYADELKYQNHPVHAVVTDVSKEDDLQQLAKSTIDYFGGVHFLFNNAGVTGPIGAIWEVDMEEFHYALYCNFMSVVYGLRIFVPLMLKETEQCYIINTASSAGLYTGAPNASSYSSNKHAVVALSESLFFDLQERNANITIAVLCPGLVATNFVDNLVAENQTSKQAKGLIEFLKSSMKKRGKSPADIANEVFRALQQNKFYILSHFAEHKNLIQNRLENILQRENPSILAY